MNKIITDINQYDDILKKIIINNDALQVIALVGNLGSGKTTLTKVIARQLGITQDIISPTFIIHREYLIPNSKSFLHHLDLYRLDHDFELDEIGVKNLLQGKNKIVIEWADKFKKYIETFEKQNKTKIIWIKLEYIDDKTRRITI